MHRTPRLPRRAHALFAVVALVAAAAACSSGGSQDASSDGGGDLRSVTLMLNWTPNAQHAGIYAADELGYYEDAGIDLEIVEPAETGVEPVVASGEAEFGISQAEFNPFHGDTGRTDPYIFANSSR